MMMELSYEQLKISVGVAVVVLGYIWLRRYSRKRPPGPISLPLIGNLLAFRKGHAVEIIHEMSKKYGGIFSIYLGWKEAIVLSSYDAIREALLVKGNDFAGRPRSFTSDLFTDSGKDIAFGQFSPTWQLHRKLVHNAIRNYATGRTLEEHALKSLDVALEKMKKAEGAFNPKQCINILIFNIITSMAFGKVYEDDNEEFTKIIQAFDEVTAEMGAGLIEDFIPAVQYVYTPAKTKTVKELFSEYLEFLGKQWEEHKRNYDPNNLADVTDFMINIQENMKNTEDAELLKGITDAHMVQTVSDFFGAGVDTSRYTLQWVIAFLAANPEVQRKMQKQIDDVCGSRPVALSDKNRLPYVDAVLYETMRIGTVVPTALPHTTTCDTKVGGYDIPKDTMVLINIYALHYNPDMWPEPTKFNPERFLDADGNLNSKSTHFMPFSCGRRVCVGEVLAKQELNLLVASLYQRVSLVAPPGEPVVPERSEVNSGIFAKDYKVVLNLRD